MKKKYKISQYSVQIHQITNTLWIKKTKLQRTFQADLDHTRTPNMRLRGMDTTSLTVATTSSWKPRADQKVARKAGSTFFMKEASKGELSNA